MTRVSIPAVLARSSPAASARFEITTAILARSRPSAIASVIALMFEPRPEMSTSDGDGPFFHSFQRWVPEVALMRCGTCVATCGGPACHAGRANQRPRHSFTSSTGPHGEIPIFTRPTEYRAFIDVLDDGLERYPVKLLAYCVMSNHWHLVVGPEGTESLSRFMRWVSSTHAVRWHHRHGTVGQGAAVQGTVSRATDRNSGKPRSGLSVCRAERARRGSSEDG